MKVRAARIAIGSTDGGGLPYADQRAGLAREAGFDPAESLHDRLLLLLQAFEPAVNFVEVAEHLAPQLGNLPVDAIKALIDLGKLTAEEVNELLVLGGRHGALSQMVTRRKHERGGLKPGLRGGASVVTHKFAK